MIFDTLISQSPASEVEAVLAHELGHWYYLHPTKLMIISQLHIFFVLAAFPASLHAPLQTTEYSAKNTVIMPAHKLTTATSRAPFMSSKLSSVLYRLSLVLQFLGSWVPNWVIQSQNYYAKQVRKGTYKIHLSAKSSALKNWSPHPYFNILSHLGEWYSSACIRDKHVARHRGHNASRCNQYALGLWISQ